MSSFSATQQANFAKNSDPAQGVSLCIPRVFNNISWRRIKQHIIEANPVPLRVHVEFAHGIGLIPFVAEGLSHRRQIGHGQIGEDTISVGSGRAPRHQRASCRNTDRCLGIGPGEAHAIARELIEGWRLQTGMPSGPQKSAIPVISGDQQYMGTILSRLTHRGSIVQVRYPRPADSNRSRPATRASILRSATERLSIQNPQSGLT